MDEITSAAMQRLLGVNKVALNDQRLSNVMSGRAILYSSKVGSTLKLSLGGGVAIGGELVRFEYGVGFVVVGENVHHIGAVSWDVCF